MRALVVYYSRTGVTGKACNAIADALKALDPPVEVEVEEIVDRTDRSGPVGYMRGGKDAMLKRSTEIEPIAAEVAEFDLVVIGTPVWAWSGAPATRAFCEQFAEQLETVAFVATMGGSGDRGAYRVMEEYCGSKPTATLTLLEKHVKAGDEENYLRPVEALARELAGK